MRPRATVLLPVFDQAAFLPRAVGSLLAQTVDAWEAVVLDDGSRDGIDAALEALPRDPRLTVRRWPENRGLGTTLNRGLDLAAADVVAYLPADDVWFADHLEALLGALDGGAPLACTGVRHHHDQESLGAPPGFPPQLVQVAHRHGPQRWTERAELESDDLTLLFWRRAGGDEPAVPTGRVTCEWTDHPWQRHKAVRERFDGGLNVFRSRYGVRSPLRFHSTDRGLVDEVARYRRFREASYQPSESGLTVLLVGELAYNPERVLALAERGHRLHGLWTTDGLADSTVGPLPFGHVQEVPRDGWREEVRKLAPDVIYALLNWRAVPFAHEVLRALPDIPYVWHFKEAPQRSIVRGEWPQLADLVSEADACLLSTTEERDWFLQALPGRVDPDRLHVLDGDLPKADWLHAPRSERLSERDGQVHTVVAGRPSGLDAEWLVSLAHEGVHTHLYGQVDAPGPSGSWRRWWDDAVRAAPGMLHLHPPVGPEDWVPELSQYDAGWLHRFTSSNGGDLRRATWDDLNSPARLPVLLAAGLPLLQQANPGHTVAVDRVARESGAGLLYGDAGDVVRLLQQEVSTRAASAAAWEARWSHTFDAHADGLVGVLEAAASRRWPTGRACSTTPRDRRSR